MKHQRKMAFKKVRTLQEDAKCPAELMDAAYRTRDELDLGCARANIRFCEARFLVEVLQENPMPPIEELRKKVDEDWAAGTIGPPNTDGFDGEGRHVAERGAGVNQRDGGVSHRHPLPVGSPHRRGGREGRVQGRVKGESKEGAGNACRVERASGRTFLFFFVATGVLRVARRDFAGGPSPGTKPRRGRACRPSGAA